MASGQGTSFEHLVKYSKKANTGWGVCHLITNTKTAGCIEIARHNNVPFSVIDPREYPNFDSWDKSLSVRLQELQPDLILLLGFLKKIGKFTLSSFPNQVLNTHPSLLPKYGGEGMFGMNVHRAVIKNNDSHSGATLHYVNEEYDRGAIIRQVKVPLGTNESAESLAEKIKSAEKAQLINYLDDWSDSSHK